MATPATATRRADIADGWFAGTHCFITGAEGQGDARRYVRDFLADAGCSDSSAYPAVLATSELVTNAVVHAATRVDLQLEMTGGTLRVEVVDYGDGCPVLSRVATLLFAPSGSSLVRSR